MSVATTAAEAPKNRFPGPCAACGTHVRAWAGTRQQLRGDGRWIVYCAAHSPGASAPANDRPSNGAPTGGDAPEISEDSARAAIALLRRAATDKRAPAGAVDALVEICTLCVWRVGTPAMARELAEALPRQAADDADERAVDLVREILDHGRVSDADAAATADALVGPPVDSPTSRAFAPVRNADMMPAPKRERSTKGAGRWSHRKGNG